jgi:hypothetical protein
VIALLSNLVSEINIVNDLISDAKLLVEQMHQGYLPLYMYGVVDDVACIGLKIFDCVIKSLKQMNRYKLHICASIETPDSS